jgi:serine/threonine protein kinase
MKLVEPSEFFDEVNILKKLKNHEHIIGYQEDFNDQDYHCIITEYCEVKVNFEFSNFSITVFVKDYFFTRGTLVGSRAQS